MIVISLTDHGLAEKKVQGTESGGQRATAVNTAR
jgi:hypothetical protein